MAVDIHGKWQKRNKNSENWQDINGNFKWFHGNRNRELFFFLNDFRNPATDDIEKELMLVLSEENYPDPPFPYNKIKDLNAEGYNFWGAGYLTLDELYDLMNNMSDNDYRKDSLESFVREIEMYVNDDNDAEYRAIFVFDN